MNQLVHGILRGRTIELDEALPPLDGKRVLVTIAAEESGPLLVAESARAMWDAWVKRGEQGPIDDEGEPEFP